ncbi:MAG: hypothetical protein LBF88_13765 [Planctomycetaceae bacterium]|nr:hypothetical protein [Planctomycetaceae bacterium]
MERLQAKSKIPIKKPRGGELLELGKVYHRRLARERDAIEHINRTIKTFRILKERYRNRRKRHYIHTTLICPIKKHELKVQKD